MENSGYQNDECWRAAVGLAGGINILFPEYNSATVRNILMVLAYF